MSAHYFDPAIASKVGIPAAVIYQNIKFWIEKNEANDEQMHEGRYWTYSSIKALEKLFPYLTVDQVRRAVDRCISAGLLGTGNFNETPYDRTRWFCLLDGIQLADIENGNDSDAEPIPDITTDITTDREDPPIPPAGVSKPAGKPALSVGEFDAEFDEVWPYYPRKVGIGAARKAWAKARRSAPFDAIAKPLGQAIRVWRRGTDVDKIPHLATWLNQQRWLDNPEHGANRTRTSTEDLNALATISSTDDIARLMAPLQLVVPR